MGGLPFRLTRPVPGGTLVRRLLDQLRPQATHLLTHFCLNLPQGGFGMPPPPLVHPQQDLFTQRSHFLLALFCFHGSLLLLFSLSYHFSPSQKNDAHPRKEITLDKTYYS